VIRHDYAFPFAIDAGSSQAAQVGYRKHVEQLLRQLLLTSPGERTCMPEFGCGLRQLVFAPQSEALTATVRIQVRQAIERWLTGIVALSDIDVASGASNPSLGVDEGELLITIDYRIVETQTDGQLRLRVR
jgi:phage baseplate assembly protein W